MKQLSFPEWSEITSQYENSKCCVCKQKIPQGEKCLWKHGSGIKHIAPCDPELTDLEEEPYGPDDSALVILEKDWYDPNPKPWNELKLIKKCQHCGEDFKSDDTNMWVNVDLRTCRKCFRN